MVEKEKDIVETLRYHASLSEMDYGFCAEAAEALEKCRDEIERLRAKLKEAEEEYDLGEMARIAQEYNLDPIGDFLEWSRKRKT